MAVRLHMGRDPCCKGSAPADVMPHQAELPGGTLWRRGTLCLKAQQLGSCLLRCILSWQHTTLLLTGMMERGGSLETPSCDPLDMSFVQIFFSPCHSNGKHLDCVMYV